MYRLSIIHFATDRQTVSCQQPIVLLATVRSANKTVIYYILLYSAVGQVGSIIHTPYKLA